MESVSISQQGKGSPPRQWGATSFCRFDFSGRCVLPAQMGSQHLSRRSLSVMSSDMHLTVPLTTTARRTIASEAMLWLRKGFGFAGGWTVNDQNDLLARGVGLR